MASKQLAEIVTGIGRFVGGDAFVPSTTDRDGKPRVVKTGANAGQPNPQVYVKIALPKTPGQPVTQMRIAPSLDAEIASGSETGRLFAVLKGAAAAAFPHLFPQGAAGPCTHPAFSWKIADGDGHDESGKPLSDKEGYAGHWILTATRNVGSVGMPKIFTQFGHDRGDMSLTVATAGHPRAGDYVKVAANITSNENVDKPGLYVNLDMLCAVREGAEIQFSSGPSAEAAFGGTIAPAHPAAAAAFAPPPTAPQPVAAAPAPAPLAPAPSAPVPPVATPAPTPPPAPSAPPVKQLKPEHVAAGLTYDQMAAQGWTDAQLVEHGYMA